MFVEVYGCFSSLRYYNHSYRVYWSFYYLYAADDLKCMWRVWPGATVINDEKVWSLCIQRKSITFERELIFDFFKVAVCHPEYWLFLFTPPPPSLKTKNKKQKAEQSQLTQADENAIYSPHLNYGDPIHWLARRGGGEGVITSKYCTGTAAGLLNGSVEVTWFQLNWRLDCDSILLPGVFFF